MRRGTTKTSDTWRNVISADIGWIINTTTDWKSASLNGCFTVGMHRRWISNTRTLSRFTTPCSITPSRTITLCLLLTSLFGCLNGVRLYGEWLIDDFQYVPGARDPHAVAWLCGVEWYPRKLARQFGIRAEYARVNRWAYTHLVPDNQFTHFGAMIGHPIGNDADTFTMRASYQFTVSTKAEFAAAFPVMERAPSPPGFTVKISTRCRFRRVLLNILQRSAAR